MGAITSLSDLCNRLTGGASGAPEHIFAYKDARVGGAAAAAAVLGRWTSLWQYEGFPSHGAAPGAAAIPDNTTTGGLKQTDPGGGMQKWFLGADAAVNSAGALIIYDRLLHISGLSGTTITAQTVQAAGVPALTRYTNGVGNMILVEVYTQIGASATTITASYTDQGGAGSTTQAVAIGGTGLREAQRMIPLSLATGDTGVQGVASVTLAGTTSTAGDFGVTIAHPLMTLPINAAGVPAFRDAITGFAEATEILADSCLAMAWIAGSTTAPQVFTSTHFVDA
jgi:hypothetical protein